MIFEWFNARDAAAIGTNLAEQFTRWVSTQSNKKIKTFSGNTHSKAFADLLRRADAELRNVRLNFYKRVKFANSFKWRLLENGIEDAIANDITHKLVLHISLTQAPLEGGLELSSRQSDSRPHNSPKYLLAQADKYFVQGAYAESLVLYQDLLKLEPRHSDALNNIGVALCKLGRYKEAEYSFRAAIDIATGHAEAHGNLGNALRIRGQIAQAEAFLRHALRLKPTLLDARINLGAILILSGRLREAERQFRKALRAAPQSSDAIFGLGQIARLEGRFEQAEAQYNKALAINPEMPSSWAALGGIRKQTSTNREWLEGAEKIASSSVLPLQEAELRFAIGKCFDDVKDFTRAFQNYKRGNDLLKSIAEPYDRGERERFVDDLIRVYTPKAMLDASGGGASPANTAVFVVGMMRSGTSLVEQILASHPSVKGAGELPFWNDIARDHAATIRQSLFDESTRTKLAHNYMSLIEKEQFDALRVVDKAPINADYLGMINSVFPNARIIYMRRNPIDTCLSCYFQQFSLSLNFTMDLADLAHYYEQHERLMTHWRAVLPAESILEVPYEELVCDQEGWTRKILDFLGLDWHPQCLNFYNTQRPVLTASTWQVRQKIYMDSVHRWQNYTKFIGALVRLDK
jgi:tetratricopeptide (TPR) repeat protein